MNRLVPWAWIALGGIAFAADDHGAPTLAPAEIGTAPIPPGDPITAHADPGADLQSLVHGLPAGSRLVLARGEHRGPLVVDRPMELVGEPGAVLLGTGFGTVMMIAADDVSVRDLTIAGSGHDPTRGDAGIMIKGKRFRFEHLLLEDVLTGIDLRQADDGVVYDCTIRGIAELPFGRRGDGIRLWESNRNRLEDNVLDNVRDLVVWYSEGNTIARNRVIRSRYATHFMHGDRNDVYENRFEENVVGVFVMYSEGITLRDNVVSGGRGSAGVGLGFKDSRDVMVQGNRLINNTTGLYLDNTPSVPGSKAHFADNLIAYNDVGLRLHGPQPGPEFLGNDFHENTTAVTMDVRADSTGVRFDGNQWSDYAGYDLDGDGFGDIPFELRSLSGDLRDREPAMAFFVGTPAAGLLDLLGAAFPLIAPRPLMSDPRPRMTGESS